MSTMPLQAVVLRHPVKRSDCHCGLASAKVQVKGTDKVACGEIEYYLVYITYISSSPLIILLHAVKFKIQKTKRPYDCPGSKRYVIKGTL